MAFHKRLFCKKMSFFVVGTAKNVVFRKNKIKK